MSIHDEEDWPATLLIEHSDALRWALPREFGGEDLDPLALHLRYEHLASRSLPLALILTQRDSAISIIANSTASGAASPAGKAEARSGPSAQLLSEIRDGAFVTVGIAQLTTSRQGILPALAATPTATGYQIDGVIPWSTGAAKAKYVVAGAATAEGQILFALPTDAAGVSIGPPLPLVAMRSTWTSEVRCEHVELSSEMVLAGPAPNVLSTRRKSVPLPQAFLALGHCRGAVDLIAQHQSDRARSLRQRFEEQRSGLHDAVVAACQTSTDASAIPALRGRCNELALRITHAAVALYKGNALLLSHPAQRLARETMFLLVWSCPDPVIDCTVDLLSEEPLP